MVAAEERLKLLSSVTLEGDFVGNNVPDNMMAEQRND